MEERENELQEEIDELRDIVNNKYNQNEILQKYTD